MTQHLLILIETDPRVSGRAAEGVRVAAGVSAGGVTQVTVCLRGPAILTLGEFPENYADGEILARSWPVLAERGVPILVLAGAEKHPRLVQAPCHPVTERELAAAAAHSDVVMRF